MITNRDFYGLQTHSFFISVSSPLFFRNGSIIVDLTPSMDPSDTDLLINLVRHGYSSSISSLRIAVLLISYHSVEVLIPNSLIIPLSSSSVVGSKELSFTPSGYADY